MDLITRITFLLLIFSVPAVAQEDDIQDHLALERREAEPHTGSEARGALSVMGRVSKAKRLPEFRSIRLPPQAASTLQGKGFSPETRRTVSADLDGDGYSDLLSQTISTNEAIVLFGAEEPALARAKLRTIMLSGALLTAGDYDGDGRAELLSLDAQSGKLFLSTIVDSSRETRLNEVELEHFSSPVGFLQSIDMNDDGKDEVVFRAPEQSNLLIYESRSSQRFSFARFDVGDRIVLLGHFPTERRELDRTPDLLILAHDEPWFRMKRFGPNLELAEDYIPWVAISFLGFQSQDLPDNILTGDFNGDGFADVLARGRSIQGWWAIMGSESGGIPYPMLFPFPNFTSTSEVVVGDWNGDGWQDLLWQLHSSDPTKEITIELILSVPGEAVSGVEIRDGEELLGTSDHGGEFRFNTNRPVRADIPACLLTPASLRPRPGKKRQSIVAYCQADAPPEGTAIESGGYLAERLRGPFVCTGFTPHAHGSWAMTARRCPEGYALYSTSDSNYWFDGRKRLFGHCCRLPAPDLFVSEPLVASQKCPEGYVATSGTNDEECPSCELPVICRKVNQERYQLGPPTLGSYWGNGGSRRMEHRQIRRDEIPPAIRTGTTRSSLQTLGTDGCIGKPFGSLFVEKFGVGCRGLRFRELQYRGKNGDPPAGTPVPMFPACSRLSSEYDPSAYCIKDGTAR